MITLALDASTYLGTVAVFHDARLLAAGEAQDSGIPILGDDSISHEDMNVINTLEGWRHGCSSGG